MNDTGRIRGGCALEHRPCACLFRAHRKEGQKIKQLVAFADDAREAGFRKTKTFKEFFLVFSTVKQGNFRLNRSRNHHRTCTLCLGHGGNLGRKFVTFRRTVFIDVANIKDRLAGQKLQHTERLGFVFAVNFDHAGRLAFTQHFKRALDQIHRQLGVLVVRTRLFLQTRDTFFQAFHVGQHQFGFDGFRITDRIDRVIDMGDVVIFKTAQHVNDGVGFTNVGKELVAKALALRRTTHQTGNINKFQLGRNDVCRICDCRNLVKALVRNADTTGIGLNRAEREVCCLGCCRLGQGVKKGRFTNVGQTDNTAFESHLSGLRHLNFCLSGSVCACANQTISFCQMPWQALQPWPRLHYLPGYRRAQAAPLPPLKDH